MGNFMCHPGDAWLRRASDASVPLHSLDGLVKRAKVVDVYDGDTLTAVFYYRRRLTKFKVRLLGYDSPEMRSADDDERALAQRAKAELARLTLNRIVTLHCGKFEPHGRMLGYVYVSLPSACCCGPSPLLVNDYMLHNVAGCVVYGGGNREAAHVSQRPASAHQEITTLDAVRVHCSCRGGCSTRSCACCKAEVRCTAYCHMERDDACNNIAVR